MLQENIQQDLKTALKNGDSNIVSVLRMVLSAIQNTELEKKRGLRKNESDENLEKNGLLTDQEIISVLSSEAKKRKEAANGFRQGGRDEMATAEESELAIIYKYLPKQISEEEINKKIDEVIKNIEANSMKDFGRAMGVLMSELKGRTNGDVVGSLLKKKLQ